MRELQVLLDARTATLEELAGTLTTLVRVVPSVELVHGTDEQLSSLAERFPGRVRPVAPRRPGVPVLVSPGRVAYSVGAVRRILGDLDTPGRCVTRVLLPGLAAGEQVACWAPGCLDRLGVTSGELADADLEFDRAHLPAGSPAARAWLRADVVGLTLVGETGDRVTRWSRRTGAVLGARAAVAAVRAPAGAARRRVSRWRQRQRVATGAGGTGHADR